LGSRGLYASTPHRLSPGHQFAERHNLTEEDVEHVCSSLIEVLAYHGCKAA